MRRVHLSISGSPRVLLAAAWAVVCLCILAAPVLACHSCYTAASFLYLLFSRICHQIPERSFELSGYPLAACHRCCGLYFGMLLGCFADIRTMHCTTRTRRFWVLSAVIPIAFDALAPVAGLWTSTAFSRFWTGLLFGTLISSLVVRGLAECAHDAPWRRLVMQPPQLKGDIS